MKHWIGIALLALLICALAMPASADTVTMPDNNFYKSHRGECVSENRAYYANGPEGYVLVDRPDIEWPQRNLTAFTAQFVDPAGRTWAYAPKTYHRVAWWICLDAPNDAFLPPDENCVEIVRNGEAPKFGAVGKVIELNPAADEATLRSAARAHSGAGAYVIACAVGVVIVAAAVLFATLRRKRRSVKP